jgi:hypothetical protein
MGRQSHQAKLFRNRIRNATRIEAELKGKEIQAESEKGTAPRKDCKAERLGAIGARQKEFGLIPEIETSRGRTDTGPRQR